MALLKAPTPPVIEEPMRECEACGRMGKSSMMINCIIVVGSPGHPDLSPFQCTAIEHWACSLECWQKVAHACVDEHILELLKQSHERIGR